MKKVKLAIIGLGSAGIQSLCHFLSYLPKGSEVFSIYDPNIKILGIGESTNPSFTTALELGTDFRILEDMECLDATYKLGTYYVNWRDEEFLNPLLSGSLAIHFNNFKLKDFAIPRLKKKWADKFKIIEGNVESMTSTINSVQVQINSCTYQFDYVIDCRGFPNSYDDYFVITDAPVNRGIIHNLYDETRPWNYTVHRATKDGWMFEVPLSTRHSYGYLYNDSITSDELARKNFSDLIGISENSLENIEYKFKSFYAKELITNRIIKNGNRSVFFEPMFANSLWLYDQNNRMAWDFIQEKADIYTINNYFIECCRVVQDMINFHYHGGSTFETLFWKTIPKIAQEKIKNSDLINQVRSLLKEQAESKTYREDNGPNWIYTARSLMILDKHLQYNYFTDSKNQSFICY